MTTLTVTTNHDYRGESLTSVDTLTFDRPTPVTALFDAAQFGSQISNSLHVNGRWGVNSVIEVHMSAPGTFSAADWSFVGSDGGSLIGPAFSSDRLYIYGSGGGDTITGGCPGGNVIYGLGGADHLIGTGAGDFFHYTHAGEIVAGETVAGNDGLDYLVIYSPGGEDFDFTLASISSVEVLAFNTGGSTTVTLTGDQAAELTAIQTNAGAQHLVIAGSAVNLSGIAFDHWDQATDTIAIEGTSILGNTLIGSSQNESLQGAPGSRDFMRGRGGNDIYFIDHTRDFVDESAPGSGGFDIIYSPISFNLADPLRASGPIEELVLIGDGDIDATGNGIGDLLIGNGGNNVIKGGGADDVLRGRDGDDTLNGGTGNDVMNGGTGNDGFQFRTALNAANVDHLADFSHPADTFVLDQSFFSQVAIGGLAAGALRLGTAAVDGDDRIIYDQPTGRTWYDPDGNGAAARVLFAILDNHATLTAGDFMVIA